jgi:hypothetical protein
MKIFLHSGKIGDCIYSLPTIRALGGGILYLNPHFFTPEAAISLMPLLLKQEYIYNCVIGLPDIIDYNLDTFRNMNYMEMNLSDCHLAAFGLSSLERDRAWLCAKSTIEEAQGKVIFSRALRAYGYDGFWNDAYDRFGNAAVFVGTEPEYIDFQRKYGEIPWLRTINMLFLSTAINSARLFVGNQSCPHAIAEGLKKPIIIEVGTGEAHPVFERENALYIRNKTDWGKLKEGFAKQ